MSSPTTVTSSITITSIPASTELPSWRLKDHQNWRTTILIGCSVLMVIWVATQVTRERCHCWAELKMNQAKCRETCPECDLTKPAAAKTAEPIVDDAEEKAMKTMKKLEETLDELKDTMKGLKETMNGLQQSLKELSESLKTLGETMAEIDEIAYEAEYL